MATPLPVIPAPAGSSAESAAANNEASANASSDALSFNFGRTGIGTPADSKLCYPFELRESSNNTAYVRMQFFDYIGPYTNQAAANTTAGTIDGYNASIAPSRRKNTANLPEIYLYMPEDISTEYGAQWGPKSIQNTTAGILKATGQAGAGDLGGLLSTLKDASAAAPNAVLIEAMKESINALQSTGQGEGLLLNDVLGVTRNVVLNPNTELLFTGFDLRSFFLSFKMVARDQAETTLIRDIITTIKRAMLPSMEKKEGGLTAPGDDANADAASFINIPSLVDVKFMAGSNANPYLTQYKPCAITSLSVNYTPDGSFAVYDNFAPVAVTMQVGFAETKLVYREEVTYGGATY